MKITTAKFAAAAAVLAAALALSACGGQQPSTGSSGNGEDGSALSGTVASDGSSTVGPLTEAAATEFAGVEPDVQVTVATSGTGGGFKTFCAGGNRPLQRLPPDQGRGSRGV